METIRVLYISPEKLDTIEENVNLLNNEEFEKHAETYSLKEFEYLFNDEQISDLGYIRFTQHIPF